MNNCFGLPVGIGAPTRSDSGTSFLGACQPIADAQVTERSTWLSMSKIGKLESCRMDAWIQSQCGTKPFPRCNESYAQVRVSKVDWRKMSIIGCPMVKPMVCKTCHSILVDFSSSISEQQCCWREITPSFAGFIK